MRNNCRHSLHNSGVYRFTGVLPYIAMDNHNYSVFHILLDLQRRRPALGHILLHPLPDWLPMLFSDWLLVWTHRETTQR